MVVAAALALAALSAWWLLPSEEPARHRELPPAPAVVQFSKTPPPSDPTVVDVDLDADLDPDEAEPDSAPEGIQAFPPPGTKKIRVGLLVPEDFELPAGYVRHHQVTDKGRMLPAILMFHPQHPPPVPQDLIVPADRAPPGLPIAYLQVPEDAYGPGEEDE